MIDLLGRRYIIEHIASDYRRRKRYEAFQIYVTDVLKGIADLNLKYFSRDNTAEYITRRFYEVLNPAKIDTRSADEIASDVLKRAGLSLSGGNDERI